LFPGAIFNLLKKPVMRKAILMMSVLLAVAINVKAQIIYSVKGDSDLNKPVADTKKQGVAFGPEIGLNMADMALKSVTTSMKAGLAAGVVVDFGFNNHFYLQPGLFYLMNGCDVSKTTYIPSYSINLNTIQLPVNVLYKLSKPGGSRIFFGIGPYIAYNISGTSKSGSTSSTITIGDKANDTKPLDYGAGINVGYQFAMGLLVRVHYQLGFANLTPTSGSTETSSGLGLTVGYFFGCKSCR
jgi:hypothetical protein